MAGTRPGVKEQKKSEDEDEDNEDEKVKKRGAIGGYFYNVFVVDRGVSLWVRKEVLLPSRGGSAAEESK